MVGGDDHQGLPAGAAAVEPLQETADLRIGEGDLAVVGALRKPAPERRRRLVGRMGIEEVDPGKERRAAGPGEPGQGRIHDLVGRALEAGVTRGGAFAGPEGVVVDVEAPVEAGRPRNGVRADEGARGVAVALQEGGQGGEPGLERSRVVVAQPVLVGVATGEDGRVRGPGLRAPARRRPRAGRPRGPGGRARGFAPRRSRRPPPGRPAACRW